MQRGYSKYDHNVDLGNQNRNLSQSSKKFANRGLLPFCFIVLVWLIIFLIGIYVTKNGNWKQWTTPFTIASVISFCLVIVWWILRQNFNNKNKWKFKKTLRKSFSQILRWNWVSDSEITYEKYRFLVEENKRLSRSIFLFSFFFFSLLLILSILFTYLIH